MLTNFKGKIYYILETIQTYKDWYLIFFNRIFGIRTKQINLRNGLTIVGNSKSLILDLVDEIFVKEVYNPKFMKIKKGESVMDIGANIGVFSLYAMKNGAERVYSIEPLPQNISLIRKNFTANRLNEPNIINAAVSQKNGVGIFYVADLDSHGLLFNHSYNQFHSGRINVRTIKLDELFTIYKIDRLDFLKIDCEGSEGEIINSTKKSTWKRIKKIAIEYHNNVSVLSHIEIIKILKNMGFRTRLKISDNFFGYIYAIRS